MQNEPQTRSLPGFVEKWKDSFKRHGRLPTAYLLAGPEGSGKRRAADEIARTLLGRTQNNPDLIRMAPDKTSPKSEKVSLRIEAIRDLIRRLSLKPLQGGRLVVIIEDADKMTEEAANALLKTLEEPPAETLFILMSAAPERLPPTIRSRCQRVVLQLSAEVLRERLKTVIPLWQEKLESLLAQHPPSFSRAIALAEEAGKSGEPLSPLFEYLKAAWRDLAVHRGTGRSENLLIPEILPWIHRETKRRDTERIGEDMDLILETERAIEGNVNKTLALERLFMKLADGP